MGSVLPYVLNVMDMMTVVIGPMKSTVVGDFLTYSTFSLFKTFQIVFYISIGGSTAQ